MNLDLRKHRFAVALLAMLPFGGIAAAADPAPMTPVTDIAAVDMARGALARFLDGHPEIAEMVQNDPHFLKDADFLRDHPELGAFLESHPLVKADPRAFVTSQSRHYQPGIFDEISPILGVGAFLLAVLWVLRSLLESRRWNRAAKTQAEIHTKLLDRFGSSQEMLAYMQTEAGKRFLESGTVTYESDSPRRTPQLLTRILFSIQAGLVLFLLGVGLIWLRPRIASGGEALLVLGTLALALGGGFVLSAVVSYVLSKRLGLLPATPSPDRA